jgi:hypothetical protein
MRSINTLDFQRDKGSNAENAGSTFYHQRSDVIHGHHKRTFFSLNCTIKLAISGLTLPRISREEQKIKWKTASIRCLKRSEKKKLSGTIWSRISRKRSRGWSLSKRNINEMSLKMNGWPSLSKERGLKP